MRIDAPIFTGSFSLNGNTLQDLGSVSTTGSNAFVGNQTIQGFVSASAFTGSINYTNLTSVPTLVSGGAQVIDILTSINSATASFSPRINNLESKSASVDISVSNINSITASNIARLTNLESKSASVDISITNINSFTSSNANTSLNTFSASNGNTSLNSLTGSYATTGSNTFFGTQTFSGSVYIANNLIVQGSSSIQYISASSVSIGTNIVQLNTANPSVRYAGLSIIDSGSVGGSGSFLYDSVEDEFIFIHRGNGTNVTSSHFVLGPETYDSLGNELYLTTNRIPKSTGKEHLVDSCIYESSGCVGIGTSTPCTMLHVEGQATIGCSTYRTRIDGSSSGAWISFGTLACNNLLGRTGTYESAYVIDSNNGNISFRFTGAEKAYVNSSGLAYFCGRVCAASGIFSVGNTSCVGLYSSSGVAITSAGGNTGNIYQISFGYGGGDATYGSSALYGLTESSTGYNKGALVFATRCLTTDTAPLERMRITSAGDVAIGTTTADPYGFGYYSLSIRGGTYPGAGGHIHLITPTTDTNGQILGQINFIDGARANGIISVRRATSTTTANMLFYTDGGSGLVERMRITSCGRVGIGTPSPSTIFQVCGDITGENVAWIQNTNSLGYGSLRALNNSNYATVFGIGGSGVDYPYANTGYLYTDSGVNFTFSIGGSEKMKITSAGNVGICVGSLTVAGGINAGTLYTTTQRLTNTSGNYANMVHKVQGASGAFSQVVICVSLNGAGGWGYIINSGGTGLGTFQSGGGYTNGTANYSHGTAIGSGYTVSTPSDNVIRFVGGGGVHPFISIQMFGSLQQDFGDAHICIYYS